MGKNLPTNLNWWVSQDFWTTINRYQPTKAYTNHNENHQSPGVVVQPLELETQRLMRHVVLRSTLQDLALEVVTEATRGRWRGDRLVRKASHCFMDIYIYMVYVLDM